MWRAVLSRRVVGQRYASIAPKGQPSLKSGDTPLIVRGNRQPAENINVATPPLTATSLPKENAANTPAKSEKVAAAPATPSSDPPPPPPPPPTGTPLPPNSSQSYRTLAWIGIAGAAFYIGGVAVSTQNETFRNGFESYVPLGSALLQIVAPQNKKTDKEQVSLLPPIATIPTVPTDEEPSKTTEPLENSTETVQATDFVHESPEEHEPLTSQPVKTDESLPSDEPSQFNEPSLIEELQKHHEDVLKTEEVPKESLVDSSVATVVVVVEDKSPLDDEPLHKALVETSDPEAKALEQDVIVIVEPSIQNAPPQSENVVVVVETPPVLDATRPDIAEDEEEQGVDVNQIQSSAPSAPVDQDEKHPAEDKTDQPSVVIAQSTPVPIPTEPQETTVDEPRKTTVVEKEKPSISNNENTRTLTLHATASVKEILSLFEALQRLLETPVALDKKDSLTEAQHKEALDRLELLQREAATLVQRSQAEIARLQSHLDDLSIHHDTAMQALQQALTLHFLKQAKEHQHQVEAKFAEHVDAVHKKYRKHILSLINELNKQSEQLKQRSGTLETVAHLQSELVALETIMRQTISVQQEHTALHRLIIALDATEDAVASRASFSRPLEVLKAAVIDSHLTLSSTCLQTITDEIADHGVLTIGDLRKRFNDVRQAVSRAAYVHGEGGMWSHLTSSLFSLISEKPRGYVEGDDVEAIIARADYFLLHNDLDSAAREINQLTGWPRQLSRDWLVAARQHLQVRQALDVVTAEASFAMLTSAK